MIPVEDIRPGFTITLPKGGSRTVSNVDTYEDGTLVVVYFQHGEETHESSRGGGYGGRHHSKLVKRSLKPHHRGELVPAQFGQPARAEQLSRQYEHELAARLEAWLDRIAA